MRISDWSSDVCSSDLKALLAEAGFPNGVTIKAIHTTLPGMLATIEATQALLKEAGINLEITTVEHATFHAQIRQDLSQVVDYSAARFPNADVYLKIGRAHVGTHVTNAHDVCRLMLDKK